MISPVMEQCKFRNAINDKPRQWNRQSKQPICELQSSKVFRINIRNLEEESIGWDYLQINPKRGKNLKKRIRKTKRLNLS